MLDYEERGEEIRLEWKRLQAAVADKHQELMRLQEQISKAFHHAPHQQ